MKALQNIEALTAAEVEVGEQVVDAAVQCAAPFALTFLHAPEQARQAAAACAAAAHQSAKHLGRLCLAPRSSAIVSCMLAGRSSVTGVSGTISAESTQLQRLSNSSLTIQCGPASMQEADQATAGDL